MANQALQTHRLTDLRLPSWVDRWLGENPTQSSEEPSSGVAVHTRRGESAATIEVVVADAGHRSAAAFETAVADAYRRLLGGSADLGLTPIRFWNYIPQIHVKFEDGLDHYERFNVVRHAACTECYGQGNLDGRLAAASGVGNPDAALVVQVLAAEAGGEAIENPRQIPAYRYSMRYGPKPPCFARGTRVVEPDGSATLLVSGTAAVRGEASQFIGDLAGQIDETFENLGAMLKSAGTEPDLNAFESLRLYASRQQDVDRVLAACGRAFGPETPIEWLITDLCRSELWVEIEGLAPLPG